MAYINKNYLALYNHYLLTYFILCDNFRLESSYDNKNNNNDNNNNNNNNNSNNINDDDVDDVDDLRILSLPCSINITNEVVKINNNPQLAADYAKRVHMKRGSPFWSSLAVDIFVKPAMMKILDNKINIMQVYVCCIFFMLIVKMEM